jgi:hypothetical protein
VPGAPAQGRIDDLKATCCPAAAGPAEPLACGLDTPEVGLGRIVVSENEAPILKKSKSGA